MHWTNTYVFVPMYIFNYASAMIIKIDTRVLNLLSKLQLPQ